MIHSHLKQPVDAHTPEQLRLLQRVFDRACEATGIKKNTLQAEGLAATVIKLYNSGIQDEEKLEVMLETITII
ncbi:hypothetical protein E2F50_13075 [Rhizobium deserti]|uniref:Uncharacterized protein n=1 Tax=Rhizobium deserti TaxID=2547961 RepID=A0A4R5UH05_9HYPH|nr:hypothetical protein [Rhizobium deserti]TDK35189.1 hypothetical protein E2F50_13075 [Rhizobium deserti]